MTNNFDLWNDMFKAQKSMFDAWTKMAGGQGKDKKEDGPNFSFPFMPNFNTSQFGDAFKFNQSMMDTWGQWMSAFNPQAQGGETGPFAAWQKAMTTYDPMEAAKYMSSTANEVFDKMLKSNAFYLAMYEVWDSLNKNVLTPGAEDYKNQMENFMDQYEEVLMENFIPLLPDEAQSLILNPYKLAKTSLESTLNFFQPWTESANELIDLAAQTALKDPSKLGDLIKLWKQAYDASFGALATSPATGIAKETIEQNNKMVDSMIDMVLSMSEYMTSIGAVATEHSRKAFEDYLDMVQEGSQPQTFKEFFDIWSDKVEEAIEDHFYTDEFSKLIAATADSAMKFKIDADALVENYLAMTPLVTKSQMDSLYKTVYDLKKEVKDLKKALEEANKKTPQEGQK